jgi:hypothetical protein
VPEIAEEQRGLCSAEQQPPQEEEARRGGGDECARDAKERKNGGRFSPLRCEGRG